LHRSGWPSSYPPKWEDTFPTLKNSLELCQF
jgi:hypothetical protein